MADEKISLGDLLKEEPKETQNKKVSLGDLLKEEPVKKKEFAQPSTSSLGGSRFLQEKPITTARTPFLPGAEEKIQEAKALEGAVRKQKEVVKLTETLQKPLPYQTEALPDFNLNVVRENPISNKLNKINKAIEINKLQALEGVSELNKKKANLESINSELQRIKSRAESAQNEIEKQQLSQEFNTKLQNAQALEADYNGLVDNLKNIDQTSEKLSKGADAIKSMSDEKNSTFVNSLGNFYNSTLPLLVRGTGYFVGMTSDLMSPVTNPAVAFGVPGADKNGDYIRTISDKVAESLSVNVDDDFKNKSIFEKDADGNYSNLKSPTAWANFITSTGGQIATAIVTGGASTLESGAAVKAVGALTAAPSIYEGAKDAGLNNQEAAMYAIPITLLVGQFEADGIAPIITKEAKDFFYKSLGTEIATEAIKQGGKDITPQILQNVFGKAYQNVYSKAVSKFGNIVTDALPEAKGEFYEQALQGFTQIGYDASYGKGKEKGKGAFGTTFKDVLIQSSEAGLGGFVAVMPFSTIKNLSSSQKSDLNNLIKDASADNKVYSNVIDGLTELRNANEITVGEYNQYVNRFKTLVETNTKVPQEIDGEARLEAIELVKKKDELLNKRKSVDDSFYEQIDSEVSDINNKLKELSKPTPKPVAEVTLPTVEVTSEKTARPGSMLFSEPDENVKKVFDKYKKGKGIDIPDGKRITEINIDDAKRRADAFDKMKHDPNNPEVKASYEAMANETIDQYNELEKDGYKIEIYEGEGEPYANSQEMLKDMRDNKHLFILSTEKDFGQGKITDKQRSENPLLRDSGIKDINGKTLLINDIFRFVHDSIHAVRGVSFGAKGEENAWDTHARTYSPLARRAMTTETRGQNSWVNFSGKNDEVFNKFKEANRLEREGKTEEANKLRAEARSEFKFAEQKIGLMPEWASELPEENLQTIIVPDAPEGNFVNIGMLKGTTNEAMTVDEILSKIPADVSILESNEVAGTEPTLSVKLSRPLTDSEMNKLLSDTEQMAIPQLSDGSGTIYGSKDWGEFSPEYFQMPNGEKLSYVSRKKEITNPIVKRVSRVISNITGKADSAVKVLSESDFYSELRNALQSGKAYLQAWGGYVKNGFEETQEYKNLKENGVVVENFDISDLSGEDIYITSPDNMLVGSVVDKDGNVMVEGQGGVNYVLNTGNVWAHSKASKSKNMVDWINAQVDKNGVAHIIITKGSESKLLNTHVGATGAMRVLENLVDKGLISVSDFRKALIKTGKGYGLDFNATSDLKSIHTAVKDQFYNKSDSTFPQRGTFIQNLIVATLANARKSKRFDWDGIKSELNITDGKFVKDDIKDAIGKLFADELTINGNVGDAYAVIEVTSRVYQEDDLDHPAYPSVIKTSDGSTPRLLVMNAPRYIGDIANDQNNKTVKTKLSEAGKEVKPHMILGSGNVGFSKGKIKDKNSLNVVKFMAKKKSNLIEDTYYEPFMTETKDGKNYVFFHVSGADEASIKKGIDSRKYFSTRTSKAEKSMQYGLASFYTKESDGERMVGGKKYAVVVPKNKVYPMDKDPNNYREKAEKKNPVGKPFREESIKRDMADMAKNDGYEMAIGEWYYDRMTGKSDGMPSMRADALVVLKPEKEIGKYKTNEDKDIPHPSKQEYLVKEELNNFLSEVEDYFSQKEQFDDTYSLVQDLRVYENTPTQEEFDQIMSSVPKKLKNKAENLINKIYYKTDELGEVYGFEYNGVVYMNDSKLNPNTPIHEMGHIWIDWAEKNRPDLFNSGMNKVEGSQYLKDIKSNNFYVEQANKLNESEREAYYKKEALAKAIGDNGEQFATESERTSFKQWVMNMWRKVISYFGIKNLTPEEVSNLTLDEFSKMVAADILEGKGYEQYTKPTTATEQKPIVTTEEEVIAEVELTPLTETTFDMIIDPVTNKQKYNSNQEAMADYRENGLSEYGESFEEFLQRMFCP